MSRPHIPIGFPILLVLLVIINLIIFSIKPEASPFVFILSCIAFPFFMIAHS